MRLFLIAICLLPGPAFADCRSNTFGSVTQTQCDDGSSYNSFEMNKQTIINGTDAEGRADRGLREIQLRIAFPSMNGPKISTRLHPYFRSLSI